ncbi:MAG: cbb3-type cytochrome c oxidase subunit II [Acidobacteriota bacterium]|nr:cbb3-type cytochrome c oxidase subunit II [Acidobacteriota bacterium]
MSSGPARSAAGRGAALVAITYVYFLIFAQFAFLDRLAQLDIGGAALKGIMGSMALGGIALSLLTPRLRRWPSPQLRLRAGFLLCAFAALLSLAPLSLSAVAAVALLIGAGLGLLTVTLVTHLAVWCNPRQPLLTVGLGTGVGYFLCNVPWFFAASPQVHAIAAALLCLFGVILAPSDSVRADSASLHPPVRVALPFALVVAGFAALVWLDSAAFYIIQHTPALKAGTWQGTAHLWTNAVLHLIAALVSAMLLRRSGLLAVLAAAFVALAAACWLLLDPARALPASLLYPVGVSLYSVALVAFPSLLSQATSQEQRARQAGWLYAMAGWIASALGIGMGQNLGHVPPLFLAAAGLVVLPPALLVLARRRSRELILAGGILAVAFAVAHMQTDATHPALSPIERGRQVYISEGCIHCHSQYVRPGTADVLMWGPIASLDAVHAQQPPLIGNRRQGPDLAQVGGRRSPLWLEMHFFDPRAVSGSSIMPSYAFLFRDERGEDLVAYLASLRGPGTLQHVADEGQWAPSLAAVHGATAEEGHALYARFCATCHDADGATLLRWRTSFHRPPNSLAAGPFFYLPPASMPQERFARLAQITRFGLPGTEMAGHEYLSDTQVASITLWLMENIAQPSKNP